MTKERAGDMALAILESMIECNIGEVCSGFKNEEIETRVREVHGWASGTDMPPKRPDMQSACLYGLIFLAASNGFPEQYDEDMQVALKKLYFRQIISHCRYDLDAPEIVCKVIDRWMAKCNLEPKYDWREGGREVMLSWSPGYGTLFVPLSAAVEQAARLFLAYPAEDAPHDDFVDWSRDARFSVDLISMQHDSPYHGDVIRRINGALVALAEKAGIDTVRRQLLIAGERIGETIEVHEPPDLDACILDIEIDLGLRAEEAPSTAGWKERRKARRKGARRR